MSLNPHQLFISNALKRSTIAQDLNEALEQHSGLAEKRIAELWFKEDDDRLTDEICTKYAAAIGELPGDNDAADEEYDAIRNKLLVELGCTRRGPLILISDGTYGVHEPIKVMITDDRNDLQNMIDIFIRETGTSPDQVTINEIGEVIPSVGKWLSFARKGGH